MKTHTIVKRLSDKGFQQWNLEGFESVYRKICKSNIQIWKNGKRVIVIKSYSSKPHFSTWLDDQIPISYLYDILETKSKNNLYFLMILNWEVNLGAELVQQINRAEKDELVCRKYVLCSEEDLERVPFLQEDEVYQKLLFDYEKNFKENLFLKEPKIDTSVYELVDAYFQYDYFSEVKTKRLEKIKKIIIGDEEYETRAINNREL